MHSILCISAFLNIFRQWPLSVEFGYYSTVIFLPVRKMVRLFTNKRTLPPLPFYNSPPYPMGILDWWCHPFHHCPNSSFDSLEFYLRKNLSWILIGRGANGSGPRSLLMLTCRASSESVPGCACPCPALSQRHRPAWPPWSVLCSGPGAAAVLRGPLRTLSLGLLKVQPSHHLLSPSPKGPAWIPLHGISPVPNQGRADSTAQLPRSGLVVERSPGRKPATSLWTRGRVEGIKIAANNRASQTSPVS